MCRVYQAVFHAFLMTVVMLHATCHLELPGTSAHNLLLFDEVFRLEGLHYINASWLCLVATEAAWDHMTWCNCLSSGNDLHRGLHGRHLHAARLPNHVMNYGCCNVMIMGVLWICFSVNVCKNYSHMHALESMFWYILSHNWQYLGYYRRNLKTKQVYYLVFWSASVWLIAEMKIQLAMHW